MPGEHASSCWHGDIRDGPGPICQSGVVSLTAVVMSDLIHLCLRNSPVAMVTELALTSSMCEGVVSPVAMVTSELALTSPVCGVSSAPLT